MKKKNPLLERKDNRAAKAAGSKAWWRFVRLTPRNRIMEQRVGQGTWAQAKRTGMKRYGGIRKGVALIEGPYKRKPKARPLGYYR